MDLLDFHRMLVSDHEGQLAFRQALFDTIRGGETVLDLGTGTGIHALFACQAGARRVYAVDQHEVIELARQVCRANGYGDRIQFLQTPAAQLSLPERVDVIVTHLGLSGLFDVVPRIRGRLLKSTGVLIPGGVDLFAAPLQAPAAYQEAVTYWERRHYELSFQPARRIAVNTIYDHRIDPSELLAEPARLATFDLSRIEVARLSAAVEHQVTRPGVLHGLGIWYVQSLTKNTALSTAPGSGLPLGLWKSGFLPIDVPTELEPGDRVKLRIRTGAGGWGKVWNWDVGVEDRLAREKARCAQSTFSAWLLSKNGLRGQALDHEPRLTRSGAAAAFVLELCDGTTSLRHIEKGVFERFPELFASQGEAAEFVARFVPHYSI